ncbi:MAG: LL-diaminopimelate aminotransferase [Thermodesulfobacteriota bacterium]
MIRVNENYLKLQSSYLFSEVTRRVEAFQKENPDKKIIKMGVGDVTRALPDVCIKAFHAAIEEMAADKTFKGYGPERGYDFLRQAVCAADFQARGAEVSADEIFISDGAKCDTGNIQEIFSSDLRVAVPDPVYPVYVDTNVMAGRTGIFDHGRYEGLVYIELTKENGFTPELPVEPVDLIYLCSPNNPTGATISREKLKLWVDYALENKALILFDAAYETFIRDDALPHSIFEIEGARECAIEFRSFSKTAGFTGTRCAYTIVPKDCLAFDSKGGKQSLHSFWNRRQTTKFNGVSYPVQKAAAAIYSEQGKAQVKELVDYYLRNASLIREKITGMGLDCVGGKNSPYIWVDTGIDSWEFFNLLLNKAGVVCTPGVGFGRCGQGYIRLSAFNNYENVQEAMERIVRVL